MACKVLSPPGLGVASSQTSSRADRLEPWLQRNWSFVSVSGGSEANASKGKWMDSYWDQEEDLGTRPGGEQEVR